MMSTCNGLYLESLGSWPTIMPKNFPDTYKDRFFSCLMVLRSKSGGRCIKSGKGEGKREGVVQISNQSNGLNYFKECIFIEMMNLHSLLKLVMRLRIRPSKNGAVPVLELGPCVIMSFTNWKLRNHSDKISLALGVTWLGLISNIAPMRSTDSHLIDTNKKSVPTPSVNRPLLTIRHSVPFKVHTTIYRKWFHLLDSKTGFGKERCGWWCTRWFVAWGTYVGAIRFVFSTLSNFH